jgi:hypothetical protein
MAESWKTVRVFISSTFRDMQAERDHLVRFVFPRLREDLLRRRVHLVDVDLRWGVTSDQDAFELCMDEIDRCKPRFLCMLGGRYGWVPPAQAAAGAEGRSITASEIHYAALDKLDAPAFRYFYFRDPAVTRAIPEPYAADYREADSSSAAGALETIKTRIRTARGQTITAPDQTAEGPLPLFEYPCAWDQATARITKLERFGERVYADLMSSIDAEFGTAPPPVLDEFSEENAAMDAFIERRVERYIVGSREPVFRTLFAHADGTGGNPVLCLVGEPGSGKSALLGRFYRDYTEAAGASAGPGRVVIPHFVGASASSTSVRQILRRLCHELARAADIRDEIPDDDEKLREAFPKFLETAAAAQRVVILVDAVNQLDVATQAQAMRWLPETLPAHSRVILTTLPGPVLEALRARRQPPVEVALQPLTSSDCTAIMEGYLARYRKSLDVDQRSALLGKADAGVPLYLLTALEELRTLGTYEEITTRIRELPDRVPALFDWILRRLERDPGFRDEQGHLIGAELVRPYCSFIAVGRVGMAQSELVELVTPADPVRGTAADAFGNAAALQRLLRPYLMQRGELLDYFHGQLREAVQARYLAGPEEARRAHQTVAEFFRQKGDPAGDATWTGQHVRSLSELPYHQTKAELWQDVYNTLTDFAFLEAKITLVGATTKGAGAEATTVYGGVYELLEDYRRALERFPAD